MNSLYVSMKARVVKWKCHYRSINERKQAGKTINEIYQHQHQHQQQRQQTHNHHTDIKWIGRASKQSQRH